MDNNVTTDTNEETVQNMLSLVHTAKVKILTRTNGAKQNIKMTPFSLKFFVAPQTIVSALLLMLRQKCSRL